MGSPFEAFKQAKQAEEQAQSSIKVTFYERGYDRLHIEPLSSGEGVSVKEEGSGRSVALTPPMGIWLAQQLNRIFGEGK